jgi:acyl-CoA thioesterase
MNTEDENIIKLKTLAAKEPVAGFLGMQLVELTPGYAKVTMQLKPEHQNFNGYAFGGIIGAIADQAFAYGSNSVAYPSVATQFNTNFVNAPGVDDLLTAECRVLRSGKRSGLSEITVTNQGGKMIAKCTGVTVRI